MPETGLVPQPTAAEPTRLSPDVTGATPAPAAKLWLLQRHSPRRPTQRITDPGICIIEGAVGGLGLAVGFGGVQWRVEGVLLGPAAGGGVVPALPVFDPAADAVLDTGLERVGVLVQNLSQVQLHWRRTAWLLHHN